MPHAWQSMRLLRRRFDIWACGLSLQVSSRVSLLAIGDTDLRRFTQLNWAIYDSGVTPVLCDFRPIPYLWIIHLSGRHMR